MFKKIAISHAREYLKQCVMGREACKKVQIINKLSDGQCIDSKFAQIAYLDQS